MNRFEKTKPLERLGGKAVSVVIFAAALGALMLGLDDISVMTQRQEAEGLENAVRQSAVHCYALEGFYPDNLEYLEEHYGLVYDREKYIVSYETIGSNLMPDVTVIRLGGEAKRQ